MERFEEKQFLDRFIDLLVEAQQDGIFEQYSGAHPIGSFYDRFCAIVTDYEQYEYRNDSCNRSDI